MYHKWSNKGFTLIELLTVILIIATLAAIALASVHFFRLRSVDARTKSELADIRVSAQNELTVLQGFASVFSQGKVKDTIDTIVARDGLVAGEYQVSFTDDEFALVFPLKAESGYWCVDSSGNSKKIDGFLDSSGSRNCDNVQQVSQPAGEEESGSTPTICDYAAPPSGCTYVPGPNFNPDTMCGMVLSC